MTAATEPCKRAAITPVPPGTWISANHSRTHSAVSGMDYTVTVGRAPLCAPLIQFPRLFSAR